MALLIKTDESSLQQMTWWVSYLRPGSNDHVDRKKPAGRFVRRSDRCDGQAGFFPAFIDPHVHIYLPLMGTWAKDNYETAE